MSQCFVSKINVIEAIYKYSGNQNNPDVLKIFVFYNFSANTQPNYLKFIGSLENIINYIPTNFVIKIFIFDLDR